jgi:hypothetical protein
MGAAIAVANGNAMSAVRTIPAVLGIQAASSASH